MSTSWSEGSNVVPFPQTSSRGLYTHHTESGRETVGIPGKQRGREHSQGWEYNY